MEIRYVTEGIKVDPSETGCDDWKWIELGYDIIGISGIELFGSATRDVICQMDLEEAGCAVRKWLELVQDHDQ